jgi:hypothetical protein
MLGDKFKNVKQVDLEKLVKVYITNHYGMICLI